MKRSHLSAALLFFCTVIVLLNAPFWFSPLLLEQGDLAANALQVERAREFGELLGPYSQHGFHHPGPASFYLFGLAQTLFFFLPSILARHMLAQLLLNALGLGLIMRALRQAGLEMPLVAAAGFLVAGQFVWLGGGDVLMLANVWGPLVVALPVVLIVVSGARLVLGDLDWLPVIAVAMVVSLHNHIPASAVLGTVTLTVLVILVLRRESLEWHSNAGRPRLMVAGFLLALILGMMFPLVEQAKNDPGNLSLLFGFFGENHPEIHSWAEVIDKLGQAVTDPLVVLGSWTGWKFHATRVVLLLLAVFMLVSVLQARRSDTSWRLVLLFIWVSLAATVSAARMVTGPLYTYLFYYLYGLVGLLQVVVLKEIRDRLKGREILARRGMKGTRLVVLSFGVLFIVWTGTHRSSPPDSTDYYREIVEHFQLEGAERIHLFVDKDQENDQLWHVLPTLALRFRREGVKVTVPEDYVFVCGREMRPLPGSSPQTLVVTRRRPTGADDRYLSQDGWGVFLLEFREGAPADFLADLPWGEY